MDTEQVDGLLFGGMPDAVRFVVAFVLVLGLIGAAALRCGGGSAAGRWQAPDRAAASRGSRSSTSAPVDGRRRLVLIRRDNTEHC